MSLVSDRSLCKSIKTRIILQPLNSFFMPVFEIEKYFISHWYDYVFDNYIHWELHFFSGFFFSFDPNQKSDCLVLSNNNKTVCLKELTHSFALGDQRITEGLHSWRIKVDRFEEPNQMSVIGRFVHLLFNTQWKVKVNLS